MKNYLILAAILTAAVLTGCATANLTPEVKLQKVDTPVAYCPAPPAIPQIDYYHVDKLVDANVSDPGAVAQAYKYDMTYLRAVVKLQQLIILQYSDTSKTADDTKAQIDKLYQTVQQFSPTPTPVAK